MTVIIKSIKIDSFRGINAERTISFSEGLTLVHGLNGMGKTTILQAIEWCLTGEIPNFDGPDFKEEDAIVNCFSEKKSASVTLTLEDTTSKRIMTVERKRKRSKNSNTTKTNTSLKANMDGKEYENDEAEDAISLLLAVRLDDLAKNTYIRQDAIDQLLHEKPEERSRALDAILGTDKIRGFLDAINVSTARTRKQLEESIEGIEIGKVQVAAALQEEAEVTKRSLLAEGMRKEDLSFLQAVKSAGTLFDRMASLASTVGTTLPARTTLPADASELYAGLEKYAKTIDEIDRARQDIHSQASSQIIKISALTSSLQGLGEGLQQYKGKDISLLRGALDEIEKELSGIGRERAEISQKITKLSNNSSAVRDTLRDYENASVHLSQTAGGKDLRALKKEEQELDANLDANREEQRQARSRSDFLGRASEELGQTLTGYKSIIEQISLLGFGSGGGDSTPEALQAATEETKAKSKEAGHKQVQLAGLSQEIKVSSSNIISAQRIIKELELKISESIQKFGEMDTRTKIQAQKTASLQSLQKSLESFNTYDSLVAKAIEYISAARPQSCPVCDKPSEADDLLALLNSKVRSDIAIKIRELSAQAKQEKDYLIELTKDTNALLAYKADLEQPSSELAAELSKVSTLLKITVTPEFDFGKEINETNKEAEAARNLAITLAGEAQKSEIRVAELRRLLHNRQSMEEKMLGLLRNPESNSSGARGLEAACSATLESIAGERQKVTKDLELLASSSDNILTRLTAAKSKVGEIEIATGRVGAVRKELAMLVKAEASTTGEVLAGMAKEAMDLDNKEIECLKAKERDLEETKTAKASSAAQIKSDLDNMAKLIESRIRTENELLAVLKSGEPNEELLGIADQKLRALNATAESYAASGPHALEISELKKGCRDLLAGPVAFLMQEKKAEEEMEKENALSIKKQALEANLRGLEALEGSLHSIREAANFYLQNEVQNVIRSHGEQIDSTYNRLVRHPAFQNIEVKVDTDGPTYSIKVRDSEGGITTSAPVRFSAAQLNSFAISIMLANNIKAGLPFAILIMDDPTQSMDKPHKQYLAELICDLLKERQIIVVTSDVEFKSLVEDKYMGNIQKIEVQDWTVDGPKIVAPAS